MYLSCYANNMQSCSSTMNMMHDARERDMTTPFRSSRPVPLKLHTPSISKHMMKIFNDIIFIVKEA
jgi:hypothetical protein